MNTAQNQLWLSTMKKKSRQYSKKASAKVGRAVHEMKQGRLKSGKSGKKVKSRKQAIAIGLSEARKAGAKVPRAR
jgi:hypothetical protein